MSKFRTEADDAKWHANLSQLIPCIVENGRMDYSGVEADVVKKLKNFVSTQRRYCCAKRIRRALSQMIVTTLL